MDAVIHHIFAAGITQYYFRKYISLRILIDKESEHQLQKFNIRHLFIGWILLAAGLCLALASFAVEIQSNVFLGKKK